MGATKGHGIISDAARRFAAYTNVAGPSLSHFVRDTRGATAIEYAMIASLISIVIVAPDDEDLLSGNARPIPLAGFFARRPLHRPQRLGQTRPRGARLERCLLAFVWRPTRQIDNIECRAQAAIRFRMVRSIVGQ